MTKTYTSLWSGTSQAAAGSSTSSTVDLSAANGALISAKITNGATGPTIAAYIQPQQSPDGGTTWFNYGPALAGVTTNAAERSWSVAVDVGVKLIRLFSTGNTAQAVTLDGGITAIT